MCSSRYTTSSGKGTGVSGGSSRWNHTNIPGRYGASPGTGRPSAPTNSPASNMPSTTPAPAPDSRSVRCSRTVDHGPSAGSRTRTASMP
ncbi:hypothetical protein STENM36S_08175 [Streptomyces tendae]